MARVNCAGVCGCHCKSHVVGPPGRRGVFDPVAGPAFLRSIEIGKITIFVSDLAIVRVIIVLLR